MDNHETVRLINNLVRFNKSVNENEQLSLEIFPYSSIVFWNYLGNEVKQCDTFQDANKWIRKWMR